MPTLARSRQRAACAADRVRSRRSSTSIDSSRCGARRVEYLRRLQWKKVGSYHQQARVENTFFQYKSIIGYRGSSASPYARRRECLAIDVAGGILSGWVIDVLARLVSIHEVPRHLRSDNGSEFIATAVLRWLQAA